MYQLLKHHILYEVKNPQRVLSPVLFSVAMIIFGNFAFNQFAGKDRLPVFIGFILVACFFSLNMNLSSCFEPENQDGVFTKMRTSGINRYSWFFAKSLQAIFTGMLTVMLSLLAGSFFVADAGQVLLSTDFILGFILVVFSLCPLGVLLSAVLSSTNMHQILFTLLFLPISLPLLIAVFKLSQSAYLNDILVQKDRWFVLLGIVCVLFWTISAILFDEFVKAD